MANMPRGAAVIICYSTSIVQIVSVVRGCGVRKQHRCYPILTGLAPVITLNSFQFPRLCEVGKLEANQGVHELLVNERTDLISAAWRAYLLYLCPFPALWFWFRERRHSNTFARSAICNFLPFVQAAPAITFFIATLR